MSPDLYTSAQNYIYQVQCLLYQTDKNIKRIKIYFIQFVDLKQRLSNFYLVM